MKKFISLFIFIPSIIFSQVHLPLISQTPPKGTTHKDMITFIKNISYSSKLIDYEIGTKSIEKREIPVVFIPPIKTWKKDKTTIMLFAEQHGNEPSGKEALLMLIHQIYQFPKKYFHNRLNLILVPMVNPDGNEAYQRRNANHVDLNRNHVLLSEPETTLLHSLFDKYKPEVTLDVHEYGMETWLNHGLLKDFGEQLDCITNPGIPLEIKEYALNKILNPTLELTRSRDVKANRYIICRSDLDHFIRHSTTNINDGRNSFGIQYSLSFILEGLNGLSQEDRIWERAKHQLTLIENFLKICNKKSNKILNFVNQSRIKYAETIPDYVIIQADYTEKSSRNLNLTLKRTADFKDTTITFHDYRPEPEALVKVKRPKAYILENPSEAIINLLQNHGFYYQILNSPAHLSVEQFIITGTTTLDHESRKTDIPKGVYVSVTKNFPAGTITIPTNNIRAVHLVQIFEPTSFYGLSHYNEFKYLLKAKNYSIYRLNNE